MTIPMSRVKTLCSEAEMAVVQASRRPRIGELTLPQAKSFAQRAKKLQDKWRDQSRSQSRAKARQVGVADTATNSHEKAQIFQEATASLDAKVNQLSAKGSDRASKAAKAPAKKDRALKHRATRATMRAKLAEKELVLNTEKKGKQPAKLKPAAKSKSVAAKASQKLSSTKGTTPAAVPNTSAPSKAKPATRARRAAKPAPSGIQKKLADSQVHQQAATVAAKQRRVAQSGLTSRVRGHVTARGRRAQGRRDSRNA